VVCTSSNAAATLKWAWERGEKIMMLPDQHLGRNTAWKMGVPLDRMVVWDPHETWGGLTPEQAKHARLILWKGHCSVHTRFNVAQVEAFRKKYPEGKVIAHPECTLDVVQAADLSGSTEYIIDAVKKSPAGSIWAVATEVHLVNRLAGQVAPLQSEWQGVAQARFQELWAEWQRSSRGIQEALHGISQLTQQAGVNYQDTEQGIATSFGR